MPVSVWQLGSATYVAGIVWGLLMTDARPAARLGPVLLWPLGSLAFIGTAVLMAATAW